MKQNIWSGNSWDLVKLTDSSSKIFALRFIQFIVWLTCSLFTKGYSTDTVDIILLTHGDCKACMLTWFSGNAGEYLRIFCAKLTWLFQFRYYFAFEFIGTTNMSSTWQMRIPSKALFSFKKKIHGLVELLLAPNLNNSSLTRSYQYLLGPARS